MDGDTSLDKIMVVLENIEEQNLKDDPSVQKWIASITHPDFKLIQSMTSLFLDNIQETTSSSNILKVLR